MRTVLSCLFRNMSEQFVDNVKMLAVQRVRLEQGRDLFTSLSCAVVIILIFLLPVSFSHVRVVVESSRKQTFGNLKPMEFLTGICNFYLLLHILVREVCGFCEKRCTDGKSCLKFGATYVCICPKGKTGEKCEKTDTPKKDFVVGLKLKGEFKQAYEDLENPETKTLVKKIEKNMMKEFNGTGLASVKVIKLRQGSIIADLELNFNNSVGESNVNALLTQAANKGKIGDMEVEEFSVGNNVPGPTTTSQPPEDCGTFFEGEDCKKAKPGLIILCVIGGVVVLAIIVAIIAYGLHK